MKRRLALAIVSVLCWAGTSAAQTERRLPDGVMRYDRQPTQYSSFWQAAYDRFGWLIKSRPFDRSVAILVGVGSYSYLNPQLQYVKSDLEEFRNFLLSNGGFDTVFVLSDGVASANRVEDYMFNVLPRELRPNDRLLFYFSGHGADVGGVGYMQFGAATTDYDRTQYLEVTRTEQWSKRLPAKHVLFLIDACNAGLGYDAKDNANSEEGLLEQFSGKGSRNVITAGTGKEKAFQVEDGNKNGYSVFTRAFLDSIRQTTAPGGFLTLSEVMVGVERRVAAFSRDNPSRRMTPKRWEIPRSADDLGTFVFVNPRTNKPTLAAELRPHINIVPKAEDVADAPVRTSQQTARLLIVVDSQATVMVNGQDLGAFAPDVPRVVDVVPGQSLVVATPSNGSPARRQQVDVPAGEQRVLDIKFIPAPNLTLEIAMQKGGRPLRGADKEKVGEGYDGVVQSIVVTAPQAPPGLLLKREFYYLSDTGGSDGGGPIMQATTTGTGDARDRFAFPKGVRGVKFWLEGPGADQYSVSYETFLTNGVNSEARDGAPAGDWTPRVSSSQHQLVWLSLAITRKAAQ